MDSESYFKVLMRFLRAVLLGELVLFAVVSLVYWLNGWQTASQYGQGLIWGGIIAFVVGVLDLSYYWFKHLGETSGGYIADLILDKYRLKVKEQAIKEHMKDPGKSYGFFLFMTVVGAIAIAIGVLIQRIF